MTTANPDKWTSYAGDVRFDITAPACWAADQRRYLDDYLLGRLGERELPAFEMDVRVDAAACREVIGRVARAPFQRIETAPGVVLLESRAGGGSQRWFAVAADGLEHQDTAYAVRTDGRHLELYVDPGSTKAHRYPLRMIREAMLRTYEDHGGVVFHAAAARLSEGGVMICAPRSAGKTTLLACLLRCTNGDLLVNDRVIVHGMGLVAVPLPVPVARGTLDAVPELAVASRELSRRQEDITKLPATFGTVRKAEFSGREFSKALGAGRAAGAWLHSILVPRLTNTADPARITRLPYQETRRVLERNCFTPHDEFWLRPWLVPRRTPVHTLHQHAREVARQVAATVPCHQIEFGVRRSLAELDTALLDVLGRCS
ncbi:hypothetical protein GCM10011581_48450 [Saccharopolyspora subtropica]|uniref:HPr kinase n=1 Tax=Saccharopolyspora thermophila TaxID=89367 RepID=A0A917KAT4_9PSEU|nr:hypothetical protein [Saccharopolyspora subtropica]GGJ05676.1 hypothetical protein GCM10011581_48450 [Saccharopolyspora subtropica]